MKRIIYIVLLISMILPMGCKKFLSVDPPSSLSGNNFWRNKNDVEGYVTVSFCRVSFQYDRLSRQR